MSSGNLEQLYLDKNEGSYKRFLEFEVLDYSKIVIPFSEVFKRYKPSNIYSGEEKIPFKERDQEFKMILMQEFSNVIKT